MAKHISLLKSNDLVEGNAKLPSPSLLMYGEIAVNYANGHEVLSIKNDDGDIATFSSDTVRQSISLPAVTQQDNGKILMVVNGQWTLVRPTVIYTGDGIPTPETGNEGDIYIQIS